MLVQPSSTYIDVSVPTSIFFQRYWLARFEDIITETPKDGRYRAVRTGGYTIHWSRDLLTLARINLLVPTLVNKDECFALKVY